MPDGLAAFIAERLDEAEAIARAASSDDAPDGDTWHQADPDRRPGLIEDQHGDVVVYDEGSPIEVQAEHIAANDPARELRSITAKRAILAAHKTTVTKRETYPFSAATGEPIPAEYDGDCEICGWFDPGHGGCLTVRHLGTEWNDHPAYQPEWSPEPAIAP